MYTVDIVRSRREVEYCIDMYVNWPSLIPVSKEVCMSRFTELWQRRKFMLTLKDDDNVIKAYIYAEPMLLIMYDKPVLAVSVYCSNEKGIRAVRSIQTLYSIAAYKAKLLGYKYITAGCNAYDITFVLTRILEKEGWSRSGSSAVIETSKITDDVIRYNTFTREAYNLLGIRISPKK